MSFEVISISLVTGLSAFLGFWRSSAKGLWLDEAWAVLIANGSWSEMWASVTQEHAYQGFYYVLLHLWMGLFGESELAVRSLSALFGAATIPLLYLLGRSLFGRTASLAACLLLTVTGWFIRYQQEVRGYTLLLFLLVLSTYMLIRGVRGGSRWVWLVYVLASVAAVYTHLFSLWIFLIHFIVLIVAGTALTRLVHVYFWVALGSSFMFRWLMTTGPASPDWIPRPSLPYLFGELKQLAFNEPVTVLLFGALLAAAVGMGIISIARSGRSGWPLLLVLLWAVLPIVGTFLVSYVHPTLTARYLIIVFPGLALLAGWCIERAKPPFVQALLVLALVGAAVPAMLSWYGAPGDDWRGAARYVLQHAQPGDGIIALRRIPWVYYSSRLRGEGPVPEDILPGQLSLAQLNNYDRIWLVLEYTSRRPAAKRLLESSGMVRRRFHRHRPQGWLYSWPEDANAPASS